MKTSAVLASLLFGSLAVAAPVDKRALVYKTEVVTETVVVYTTVYDDEAVPQATTTPAGYFYEQPKAPSSAAAKPTSQAPANTPAVEKPTPTPAPVPQAPSPAPQAPSPSPAPVESPKPVNTPQPAPAPASSAAPAPAPSSAAPAPVASSAPSQPSGGSPSGQTYTGEITIYDNNQGGSGACGTKLTDADMIVALAQPTWGKSTYDVMTGEATNPWCGQKIEVHYKGKTITAKIMDLCPTCAGADLDLSLSAWKALTGLDEKTRLQGATWNKVS